MPRSTRVLAAAALALACSFALSGCTFFSLVDPLASATIDANEVLITGAAVGELEGDGLEGGQALEATEPFAETVDDYLASRAVGIPTVEPEACGDGVVDLVLLDRDAGAAGTVYTPPLLRFANGTEVVQTGREFPDADAADTFFTAYRDLLERCESFTVQTEDGDIVVEQRVTDARTAGVDGFVVRLSIAEPGGAESHNEQWMLRDGPFAVLVSSAASGSAADAGENETLLGVVAAVRDRLVAAVDRLDEP